MQPRHGVLLRAEAQLCLSSGHICAALETSATEAQLPLSPETRCHWLSTDE